MGLVHVTENGFLGFLENCFSGKYPIEAADVRLFPSRYMSTFEIFTYEKPKIAVLIQHFWMLFASATQYV